VGTLQAESSGEVQVAPVDACKSSSSSPLVTRAESRLQLSPSSTEPASSRSSPQLSPHSSLSSLSSLEPPEEFRDRSPSQLPTDTPEVVEAVDPIVQLVPAILQQLRQHPLESVDSIADRVASRTVTFSREEVGRFVLCVIAGEQSVASLVQSTIEGAMRHDNTGRAAYVAVLTMLGIMRGRQR
jgi:hypothetical protein